MSDIELINVCKTYQTKKQTVEAVKDVNLSIKSGDIFGVIGFSGAGKSTLIRLLNLLESPTSGVIEVDGEDITKLKGKKLREYRQEVGMIFQHFNLLWSRTVLDNVLLPLEFSHVPKDEREEKARELIKLVGLEGRENAYPSQLSGGQKQRVGIARALTNDPQILLCDEATSALDPQTTEEVLDLLLDINKQLGLTIVLITHEMNVIRKICNKVAVMETGRVIETGDTLSVFRHPEHEVTARFIKQDNQEDSEENEEAIQYLLKNYPEGILVRLIFEGDKAKETVISQVIHHYQINVNILQASLRQANSSSFGTMLVQLTGDEATLSESLIFFEQHGVGVEVI
ncbi:methionine ABC transporter ATP-binding protein [Vagococcus luciliae]|uniref:methionine ABC transporter ATP-binding protein n=1 Tax=Vagococcus luciliae TaxID=2920380 RepID=UPI00214E58F0|nr:methionine ABC transporter ATP-binding protein [Vagococcus luciliae]